jgi:AraC family transcriptional regulator
MTANTFEIGRVPAAGPLGQWKRSTQCGSVVLSEIRYSPGLRIAWHSHELAAFALTVRGTSTEMFTKGAFEHTERGLLIRPARERHCDAIGDAGATCFLIEVGKNLLADVPQFGFLLGRVSYPASEALTYLARRAYQEWLLDDSASPIAIQAIVHEIAARLIRDKEIHDGRRPPAWLRRVKQRLDEDFSQTPTLASLAAIGGVHLTHLARDFRRYYHSTIGQYLRQRRVEAASNLLSRGGLSLTEIALETGFTSHAHFCTVFKRITGLTPSEFRTRKH